jgi:hypothetical protein
VLVDEESMLTMFCSPVCSVLSMIMVLFCVL